MLATDLDGTFLGGTDEDRARLYRWIAARRSDMRLIFVTGRDLEHIDDLCKAPGFPRPDYIVGDVGTTVVTGDPEHRPVATVQDDIARVWADGSTRVPALLADVAWLRPQPGPFARRMSYYYAPKDLDDGVVRRVEAAGFDCLLSADVFFDVLPRGVSKGPTLLKLLSALGLPADRTLVAGDTLNDLTLFETGLKAVVVGNATDALLARTRALGPHVFHSGQPGAAGILDAIGHHFSLSTKEAA